MAILNANPNCQNCVITYYNTLLGAQSGSNSIPNSNSYIGVDNQVIWFRIENSNGCFNVGNVALQTSTVFTVNTPSTFNKCDSDASSNNGYTNFDLTHKVSDKMKFIKGVEALKVMSRYTFCVGVGKMFNFSTVRKDIENAICK